MPRWLITVDVFLIFAIVAGIRYTLSLGGYLHAQQRADVATFCIIVGGVAFNLVWFLVARRRSLGEAGISTAAAGVRLSRKIGRRAASIRQRIIDKANEP